MSLMSGLVESGVEKTVVARKSPTLGDWIVRNAWRLVLGFSTLFWLVIVALFALG